MKFWTLTAASNGVGSLVTWVMKSWTLTAVGNGVGSLVTWAGEFWTLTVAGNGIGLLVAWAMDYSASSFTSATTQVEVITRRTRMRPAESDSIVQSVMHEKVNKSECNIQCNS